MGDRRPPPPGSPSAELIHACVDGSLFRALQALRQGANPNAWRLNEGPALHSALAWPRIVEALLQAGAHPQERNHWCERPLEKLAADYQLSDDADERSRLEQTALLLLRLGGNPHRGSRFWNTPSLKAAMPHVVATVEAEQRAVHLEQAWTARGSVSAKRARL